MASPKIKEDIMKRILPDLWQTAVENPAPGLYTHAYLLTRETGNVLFYNTGHHQDIEDMADLGGVAYQFLSHQDELGESLNVIRQRFGAQLGGHIHEQSEFARIRVPDILFERREVQLHNIDVIPTPGHTPGSTCFYVHSAHGRYLFTGDTLTLTKEGNWAAGYIPGYSNREQLAESLKLLQELAPDAVICSGFDGGNAYQTIVPASWPSLVHRAFEKLVR